jgi:predicted metal-dependent hydrolase
VSEEQFQRGINEFNRGCFFECHDTLEDLWHETRGIDRLFLQGLIQVSVGFYHLLNRNFKGATSQFTRGLNKLQKYRPSHRGIELEDFLKKIVSWLALAERGLIGELVEIDETKIPKLQITSLKENMTWQQ